MLPELVTALHGAYFDLVLGLGLCIHRRRFPGPRLAAWSYLWILRICVSGKHAERYKGVNAKVRQPGLVRIGPNDLITDDPDIIRRMNGARSPYHKSSWYYAMKLDPYEDSLLEADIDEQLASLVALIRDKYISSDADGLLRRFDLATASQYFTLDTLTKIAYSTAFGFLAKDEDVYGYIQTTEENTDKKVLGTIMSVADKVVNARFEDLAHGREDQKDMPGSFISHGVTRQQCQIKCFYCKQKLSSQCERTSSNTTMKAMYGDRTAGLFGYSHLTGGFAGGQAEYVRVPLSDVNLLEIPDDVPDEKRSRWPAEKKDKLALVDFKKLSFGVTTKETVVSKLKEVCGGRGPDVAIECAAGEYAKGWLHWLEQQLDAETDTSEIVNEMIEGVRNYGRAGITGVYVGYVLPQGSRVMISWELEQDHRTYR
ncbi:hypothetical protein B0H63DRAFT_454147 [Podospora didyma]|uniref:Uncharacterized protein n=1 Tax=Podospora didyma TaxID=330526 RepID=A0AAE0K5C6_9PEZI|nr:hypothetical protein B0H63DRAFT_454147 [Podospora didyma]